MVLRSLADDCSNNESFYEQSASAILPWLMSDPCALSGLKRAQFRVERLAAR